MARNYIWQTFKTAERNLGECTESLLQILLRNGLLESDSHVLLGKERLRGAFFTALLAMGVVDLRSSVDAKTAVLIGERLQFLLRFQSGVAACSAAELVVDYLREVEAKAGDMPAHEAIALRMMSHVGLAETEPNRELFRNPLRVTALSRQLAALGSGWWQTTVEQRRIAA